MNSVIIIKRGSLINQTLSTIKFGQFGAPTGINYIVCDHWVDGFSKAQELNYDYGIFVNSGTVFSDITEFTQQLLSYPHYGLIGHIIDPKDPQRFFNLDQQCFVLQLNKFDVEDFSTLEFTSPQAVRSETNLHDDYTPLWIKPKDSNLKVWPGVAFGERILAKQLNSGVAVNFNNTLRDNKKFLYTEEQLESWKKSQQPYFDIAENQLWIFNNEGMSVAETKVFLGPAAGLYWIKNLLSPDVSQIELVDISRVQLKFVKQLLDTWDGIDYGSFTFEFIKENKLQHWQLETTQLTKLEKIKLSKAENFISAVNTIFEKHFDIKTFSNLWNYNKQTKTVNLYNVDIVKFLPDFVANGQISVWSSNVLDYKYTLIKNNNEEIKKFTGRLNDTKIIQL